jgi:hypothetical protein
MHSEPSIFFYIVSSLVLGGGCAYAIWYAHRQEKLNRKKS